MTASFDPDAVRMRSQGGTKHVVLSVRDLYTDYVTGEGVFHAVRGVSFDVRALERVGIVGESGSGKSALALSLLGLVEPPGHVVSGQVLLNDDDVLRMSERQLRRVRGNEISLIFQEPLTALDPIRSIGDQLIEAITLHQRLSRGDARGQAIKLLRDVEVPSAEKRLDDYPHQYSGGMRQRVVIAMALANDPDVLIADEPTTALDVTTQAQILDLLKRLAVTREASVILITHDLGIVAEFCTHVQVMYAGRVVERGPINNIFDSPVHPYTKALLSSIPRPGSSRQDRLPVIPGLPPRLDRLPRGCSFEPRCPLGHGNRICLEESPHPLVLQNPMGDVMAECHFALEQVADTSRADRSSE